MNFSFKEWLLIEDTNYDHPDDPYEEAVAKYVYDTVEKAVTEYFANDKKERFSQIFTRLYSNAKIRNVGSTAQPENIIALYVPDQIGNLKLPKHFGNLQVRIKGKLGKTGASFGGGIFEISIDMNVLAQAKNADDSAVQDMLARFEYQISHEATHISSGKIGSNANMGGGDNAYLDKSSPRGSQKYNKGKIDYYTDQGELRAHAKQYAVLYKRYFPGKQFDLKNMMSLAHHSDKIERYFVGLTGNPAQHIWDMDTNEFKDQLTKAGEFFINYVTQLVNGNPTGKTASSGVAPVGKTDTTEAQNWADRLIKASANEKAILGKESAEKIAHEVAKIPALKSWYKWYYNTVLKQVWNGSQLPVAKYTGMWNDLKERLTKTAPAPTQAPVV